MASNSSDLTLVIINIATIIPPTIMALAALRASQKVSQQVGDIKDEDGADTNLAHNAVSQHSTLKLATAILDRMDERLEAVEKQQAKSSNWHDTHEKWHAEGMPERRKSTR